MEKALIISAILVTLIILYVFRNSFTNPFKKSPEKTNKKSGEFILYFAPWCGHCKNFLPVWDEFAAKTKSRIKMTKIDCDGSGKGICEKRKIPGFPTCILYKNGKEIPFQGQRTVDALETFVNSN